MATYFMFGKYSAEALKGISADRTKETTKLITGLGGKVVSIYALLGKYDLAIIADLPGTEEAMKASIALSKLTGIAFLTSPAVPVKVFDTLIA
jgi:uncharacterized protein with GYD domain